MARRCSFRWPWARSGAKNTSSSRPTASRERATSVEPRPLAERPALPRLEPRPALPVAPPPAAEPLIRVTIGRIEVRAVLPRPALSPPSAPARPPSAPALGLDDYLKQRNGGSR